MRLKDKVSIVTGGAHGIGRAYCLGMAGEGAKVVVADIDREGAIAIAHELGVKGSESLALRTDISNLESTQEMAQRTIERFGRIDILVNNAAIYATISFSHLPFDQIPLEEWNRVIAVNITGAFLCTRAVVPHMKAQGGGKIVNISSSTFWNGGFMSVHYVTTRGGIIGMTRSLARELGEFNINVNSVAPGSTLSEDPNDKARGVEFRKKAIPPRSIKRVEYPEDLVGAVIFLTSNESDFITGQTIVVDGGHILH